MTKIYATRPSDDRETRNCRDPWFYAMITAQGGVKPCCVREPVGFLSEGQLSTLVEGSVIKKLRSQLLTGALDETCRLCPQKPLISLREFRLLLRAALVNCSVPK